MHYARSSMRTLAVLAAFGICCHGGTARAQELPEGLRHVPSGAIGFAHIKLGDLLQTKFGKQLGIAGQLPLRELQAGSGLRPDDIESATVVVLPPFGDNRVLPPQMHLGELRRGGLTENLGVIVILTTRQPFERKKLIAGLEEDHGYISLTCLSERSFAIGAPAGLALYAEHVAQGQGEEFRLLPLLKLAAKKHQIVAGGYMPAGLKSYWTEALRGEGDVVFSRHRGDNIRLLTLMAPLISLHLASVAVDVDDANFRTTLGLQGANPQSTNLGVEAVKTLMAILENKSLDEFPLAETLGKMFAKAKFDLQGATAQIEIAGSPGDIQNALALLAQGSARQRSANNLKQIGLALHSFNDTYKRLPARTINDQNGKPLLSWRVAILPFIEQQALYQQFDLNQPWDHPTNKKLIEKMPEIYAPVLRNSGTGLTHYQAFAGTGLPMEVKDVPRNVNFPPMSKMAIWQMPDGTSNTIAVTEATDPVIWTKPDDLPYDRKQPLPKIGMFRDGFHALMFDGSVQFKRKVSEETLHRAINPADGLPLNDDWYGSGVGSAPRAFSTTKSVPTTKEVIEEKKIEEKKIELPAKIVFRKEDRLAANDPLDPVRQTSCKTFDVTFKAGRRYVIDLRSGEFDTYLRLESAGTPIANDDDGGGGLNSRIEFTPERDGEYRIYATSFGGNRTGSFTLTVGER